MMPLPAGQQEGDVRCGFVTVAQDPARSDGALEKLAVAILAATGTDPQPDSLLIVNGGPGIPTLSVAMQAFTKEFAQPLQSRRDLVFVDQRGTGLSTPSLDCPEQRTRYRELLSTNEGIDYAGLFTCAERLKQVGVNLSDYTSAAIARDMVDVMQALGYDRWNVYGWSYGTRIALTALRDTPDDIRSVVLDSTVPLEADVQSSVSASFGSALTALFEDCAANPACDAAYPDMNLDTLRSARAKLDGEPVVLEVNDPTLGGKATVHVNGGLFRELVLNAMYDVRLIPSLPALIAEVSSGDISGLQAFAQEALFDFDTSADAMFFAVLCNEEVPFDEGDTFGKSICGRLSLTTGNPIEDVPVRSDVRALILAGAYDPVTPPDYGRLVESSLSNSTFVLFPYEGHGLLLNLQAEDGEIPLAHTCAVAIVAAFLDDIDSDPDAACADTQPAPTFDVD